MQIWNRYEIENMSVDTWEKIAYEEFKKTITAEDRVFPCTLGIAGFTSNQLRYGFISDDINSSKSNEKLAAMLQSFIPSARSFGKNTSLVIFFNETNDFGIDKYETLFWEKLNALSYFDTAPWPSEIPLNPMSHLWEFSFAGEPIFVVCNTPSHKLRNSRYFKNFMMTFQPRWVFDGVFGTVAPNSEKIKNEIRRRLSIFDKISPYPELGIYGSENNQEWKQYFLQDTNEPSTKKCPFQLEFKNQYPEVVSTNIKDLQTTVFDLLPPTGSIEIQFDSPNRVHEQHSHPVDETLHIIQGEITMEYGGIETTCIAGDRLLLPAKTIHRSKAGKDGCLYVIASRIIRPISIQESNENAQ